MKANVLMYMGLIIILLEVVILCNITAKSSYADSIRQSLDESLERTMSLTRVDAEGHFELLDESVQNEITGKGNVTYDGGATGLDDFKKQFVSILVQDLDPKVTDLEINFFGADAETGLLSVEVVATFNYIGGKTGTVSSYKTIIINRTVQTFTTS
jgi:hypothetical protein